jgi:prepilin-type N-terminal cleavage/methylation domain-containing protein
MMPLRPSSRRGLRPSSRRGLRPSSRRGLRPSSRRGSSAGFTLIEILVALLILGIMAALGYGTYRAARISGERTEEALKRSREIELGLRVMTQDFAESVPRPVRDILGSALLPAIRGTGGVGTLTPLPSSASSGSSLGSGSALGGSTGSGMSFSSMSFNSGSGLGSLTTTGAASIVDLTRAGWSNTAGQQRGTLQRVSYSLVDDVLKRSYQVHLDAVQGTTPIVQDLLTRVKAVQLRYLDNNQVWQTQWPAPGVQQSEAYWVRPVAVEIIIEFKDWGRVRRLIEVAG